MAAEMTSNRLISLSAVIERDIEIDISAHLFCDVGVMIS